MFAHNEGYVYAGFLRSSLKLLPVPVRDSQESILTSPFLFFARNACGINVLLRWNGYNEVTPRGIKLTRERRGIMPNKKPSPDVRSINIVITRGVHFQAAFFCGSQ